MTEIKVFEDTSEAVDLGRLSTEQRHLIFDRLAEEHPEIPRPIIESIRELFDEQIAEENLKEVPTIRELLFRKLLRLSRRPDNFNEIIPILAEVHTDTNMRVRFDTHTLTSADTDYIVPPNEEIEISGAVINYPCSPLYMEREGRLEKVTAIRDINPTIGDKLLDGAYRPEEVMRACDSGFVRPRDPELVMFDDKGATEKLARVFNELLAICTNASSLHSGYVAAEWMRNQAKLIAASLGTERAPSAEKRPTPPELPLPLADILDMLDDLHGGRILRDYDAAIVADVILRGLDDIYFAALAKGKDNPDVKAAVVKYKEKLAAESYRKSIEAKIVAEQNRLNSFRNIIESKLGPGRSEEIERQIALKPSLARSAGILSLLTAQEKRVVLDEYNRREKYIEAVLNNKCEHVAVMRRLSREVELRKSARLLKELEEFFKHPIPRDNMIECRLCGFDVICPHALELLRADIAGEKFAQMKARLTPYITKSAERGQLRCKICGELVSDDSFEIRPPESSMDEELRNFIWGEVAFLMKYLSFGTMVNVPKLITIIRDAIYPFVFETEKQILKSKTNSADEIKAKIQLYTTIYALAFIVYLTTSTRRKDIRFAAVKPGASAAEAAKYAIELVSNIRNVTMREIPGMNIDIVRNVLVGAFRAFKSTSVDVSGAVIVHADAEAQLLSLIFDPVYHYLVYINNISKILKGKRPGHAMKPEIIDETLGTTVDGTIRLSHKYERAKIPAFDKSLTKEFDQLTMDQLLGHEDPPKKLVNAAKLGLIIRSFEVFYQKVRDQMYLKPVYVDISVGKKVETKLNDIYEKHFEECKEIRDKEQILIDYEILSGSHIYTVPPFTETRRWKNPHPPLGDLYDADGRPHQWKIYIVDGREMTASDISGLVERGEYFTGQVSDYKCSVCGVLRSETAKIDENSIRSSLREARTLENFFRFYETRCPEGGVHENLGVAGGDAEQDTTAPRPGRPGSGKCTKCGARPEFFKNRNTPDALAYYHKYKRIFDRERTVWDEEETAADTATAPVGAPDYAAEYEKWSHNFNLILDLANKLDINHRLISALGAVESQDYDNVTAGTYIPSEVDRRDSTRIYVVDGYVQNLITLYNQLRYFHRAAKPSHEISRFINTSGISRQKIPELERSLPDLANDYLARFQYFRMHKRPRETVLFCIQTLCEMCLKLWDSEPKQLCRSFVEYYMKKLIKSEELLSKPGQFNWSIIFGDKDREQYDMNYNKDLDRETDPDFEEAEREGEIGDTASPMRADDFDVDQDPDADPMDVEADDNAWKVGEDIGLD